jgi:putative PIN family toxin of toxin-antitoxin system
LNRRVVFDTGAVVSALVFANGRLAWLRRHWREGGCVPLISRATASELTRVLAYPKFRLLAEERRELMADYLPYCEVVEVRKACKVVCRDAKDQMLLDLAQSGRADFLITGDDDLLALAGQTKFLIAPIAAYVRVAQQE